jgi:hypothetical protein
VRPTETPDFPRRTVFSVPKSRTERIDGAVVKTRCGIFLDLRIMKQGRDGSWNRTRNGIMLRPEFIADLQAAVIALTQAAEAVRPRRHQQRLKLART